MKFLRAGRSVRLWTKLGANTPDHKKPISQTIASVLMRRRSLHLWSRLRRFRWILRGVECRCQQSHVAVERRPEFLEFQRLLPHRVSIQTGKISTLCLKSCDRLPCATEGAGNHCVRNRETFPRTRRASQCQCSCGSCGYQSTRWSFWRRDDDPN